MSRLDVSTSCIIKFNNTRYSRDKEGKTMMNDFVDLAVVVVVGFLLCWLLTYVRWTEGGLNACRKKFDH